MDRILITGGTGCIGSNLAARLVADGHCVRIFHRTSSSLRAIRGLNVEHSTGDLLDPASILRAMQGCNTVYHAAALVTHAARRRQEVHEINVTGTRNVVEACLASGVRRLVHVSSVAAVGYPPDAELATEKTPFNWHGRPGYKLSKHLSETEIAAGIEKGLDAVMVNPSVVVGERDIHFRGGQLLRDAKRGLLLFYIDGGMNIVYVGDVVNGMILAAAKGRKGERYILSGENLTHREIFTRTAGLVGGRAPIGRLPLPVLRQSTRVIEAFCNLLGVDPWVTSDLVDNAGKFNWFSCEKAKRELSYTVTSFDETILAAYRWYRENGFL